jgi:hypothetical protein
MIELNDDYDRFCSQLEETEERIAEAHAWGASNAESLQAMRRERSTCQHCGKALNDDEQDIGDECDPCALDRMLPGWQRITLPAPPNDDDRRDTTPVPPRTEREEVWGTR